MSDNGNNGNKGNTPLGAAVVCGGGIAGMQAALDLAAQGFKVDLLEKDISIGGIMARLDKTFPTNDCSTCMISPKLIEVATDPNITIHTRADIQAIEGKPGNFQVKVRKEPRFVDLDICTGCGECFDVCPIELPADFNMNLNKRKAIYRHFPQAVPAQAAIDKAGQSPCKVACPANISAQGYVGLVAQGRFKEALQVIRRENPLPVICGRVCTHPCEAACQRGEVDEPIAIRDLKRFLTDWERENDAFETPEKDPPTGKKAAVIGSGPAGLTAAWYLALRGHQVTVFEAAEKSGGMIRYGIPDYRLPPDQIDYEVDCIESLGVEIKYNTEFGRDVTLDGLKAEGYEAFFIGLGAQECKTMGVPGEDIAGVQPGVDFLAEANAGRGRNPGEKVVVIGGGNVAIDAARTALRLGSKEVTILYRRTRQEMPAYEDEIEEALDEGIKLEYLAAPVRFIEKDGKLAGLEAIRMELGPPDASGRRRPQPVEGSEFIIDVDGAMPAIGQEPDLTCLDDTCRLDTQWGNCIAADPITLATNIEGVFAGGDVVSGPASAVEAVAMGKEAAISMDRYLKGEDMTADRERIQVPVEPDKRGVAPDPRRKPSHIDPTTRKTSWDEVVQTLSEDEAVAEASRCLSCAGCAECLLCEITCKQKAIRHDEKPIELTLDAGAVIVAPGFEIFDASVKPELGYGRYDNVINSLEFERFLSASGPSGGHVHRPSDHKAPKRIAWLQCIGSRDPSIGKDYCSYVCCMYATKQAIIAQEHDPGVDSSIFFMDVRAQGKGFDRYYERAKNERGVRYVRSHISRIAEDPVTKNLRVAYYDESGDWQEEEFDLVVLSVGLTPNKNAVALADRLGLECDRFGFAKPQAINPLLTNLEGVFTCGAFPGPKDIPETVTQAAGAAGQAAELLAPARGTLVETMDFPEEIDVSGQEPRIGVFVCHCGINIASVVDVEAVRDYAMTLPNVVFADNLLFSCSTDSLEGMVEAIKEHKLNRMIVASCSPRTHESLFQSVMRQAGLNPYLFEMANIRDQCSWVHQQLPIDATAKAKDLVRMSVARAINLEPLHQVTMEVDQTGLVIGGGVAGMTAALSLADQGFEVALIEKSGYLGGLAAKLDKTVEGFEVQPFLKDLIFRVEDHERIELMVDTEVLSVSGSVGRFSALIGTRNERCHVNFGAAVVAIGGREYQPSEYLYGENEAVTTQLAFHEQLAAGENLPDDVVMIQCVGSRDEENPYCSRTCCSMACLNALTLKQKNPKANVTVLYRDIRTYSQKEAIYLAARNAGVRFVRFEPEEAPLVEPKGDKLMITVKDQAINETLLIPASTLVLSSAIRPPEDAKLLGSRLKLPTDADGFFMEAHLKLRPVDFSAQGFFLAGLAHGPKFIEESITQAKGAAARAAAVLAEKERLVGGEVSWVDRDQCAVCLTCARTCPFGVPKFVDGQIEIDPAACQGCGACAAACPCKAIKVGHHTDAQIMAKESALISEEMIFDAITR